MLEILFILLVVILIMSLAFFVDITFGDSAGILGALLVIIFLFPSVILLSSSGTYSEYEKTSTEIKLYQITLNGQSTNQYFVLNEDGEILINDGKEQKTVSPDKVIYGNENKIIINRFKMINENEFPNNILINVDKPDEVVLYLSK